MGELKRTLFYRRQLVELQGKNGNFLGYTFVYHRDNWKIPKMILEQVRIFMEGE